MAKQSSSPTRARRSSTPLTPEKRRRFLDALAETANVAFAAAQAGMTRQCFYRHRKNDPKFAAKWTAAMKMGTDAMEDEICRRGFTGTLEPVYYRGELVGVKRKYSDVLAMFMLKVRRPEYCEGANRQRGTSEQSLDELTNLRTRLAREIDIALRSDVADKS